MNKLLLTIVLALLAFTAYTSGSISEETFSPETDLMDQLAQKGLNEYLNSKNYNLKLVEVLKCKKQVVAGKNYYLTLKMADISTNTEHTYEALVYVVPWERTAQVMNFEQKDTDFHTPQDSIQAHNIDGGYKEFDWYADEPELNDLKEQARKLLEVHLMESNLSAKNYKIKKAEVQVVSGQNVRLLFQLEDKTTWEIVIYMQIWTNTYKITSFEQQSTENFEKIKYNAGGFKQYDFQNSEYKEVIIELLKQEFNKQNKSFNNFEYIFAKSQVVSGTNIILEFSINQNEKYEAKIYIQPWTNTFKVTNLRKISPEQQLTGGMTQIDFAIEEQIIKDFIYEKLQQKFEQEQNIKVEQIDVYEAYKQVVSGLRYILSFNLDNGNAYKADFVIQLWNKSITFNSLEQI